MNKSQGHRLSFVVLPTQSRHCSCYSLPTVEAYQAPITLQVASMNLLQLVCNAVN